MITPFEKYTFSRNTIYNWRFAVFSLTLLECDKILVFLSVFDDNTSNSFQSIVLNVIDRLDFRMPIIQKKMLGWIFQLLEMSNDVRMTPNLHTQNIQHINIPTLYHRQIRIVFWSNKSMPLTLSDSLLEDVFVLNFQRNVVVINHLVRF